MPERTIKWNPDPKILILIFQTIWGNATLFVLFLATDKSLPEIDIVFLYICKYQFGRTFSQKQRFTCILHNRVLAKLSG